MSTQIITHAYDWNIDNDTDEDRTTINGWCLDKNSKPYLLRFTDFPLFCHVELPSYVNRRVFRWDHESAEKVVKYLRSILKEHSPEKGLLKMSEKLYEFQQNKKKPMLLLTFKSQEALRHCENILKTPKEIKGIGMVACRVWETDITPIRKMLTIRKIGYSEWFSVTGDKVPEEDKISTLENEFIVSYQTLTRIDPKVCQGWITSPGVLSFDIETYSDNHKALPNKYNPKHTAYMISAIYHRAGKPKTKKRYLFLMGDCNDILGTKIIRVATEKEICDELMTLIQEKDPEIITGYNIFGYDYPYLDARLKMRFYDWASHSSRLKNKPPYFTSKSWQSSGYGINDLNILNIPGRISIDLFGLIKRDFKLNKYDLSTVGKKFVGRGKHDVSAKQMFITYENLMKAKSYYDRCVKKWISVSNSNKSNSNKINKKKEEEINWKPTFHDNIDPELLKQVIEQYEKAKREMTIVSEYCVEDSEIVTDIFEKINVWIGTTELSSILGVTPMELYTRGQQIRGMSQIYNLAANLGVVIDHRVAQETCPWTGGYVGNPKKGLHHRVICLDFKSLYPSIIIAYNICYSTLVPKILDNIISDDMCNIIEWTENPDENEDVDEMDIDENGNEVNVDEDDINESANHGEKIRGKKVVEPIKYRIRYIKKEYKEGILPILVGQLINERNAVKKQMKNITDPVVLAVLDKRQWALKISANSVFGMTGAANGKLPCQEVAMSITAKGRELIQFSADYLVKEHNANIIYGDTDSVMFNLPYDETDLDAIESGWRLEKELSAKYKDPLYFECEKVGIILLLSKKKYRFWMLDMIKKIRDPNDKNNWISNPNFSKLRDPKTDNDAILNRGCVLARRDNCLWQRGFFSKVSDNLLEGKSFQETLDIIIQECMDLYQNKISWEQLVIIRGLGSNYKSESYFMKIFGDELKKIGKPASPGDRLEYVIVKSYGVEEKQLLGYKMRLPETYLERLDSDKPEYIDTSYYLEKVIMNCIEQLWQVGFIKELEKIEIQNKYDNFMKIVNHLYQFHFPNEIKQLMNFYQNDPEKVTNHMLNTHGFKNKTIEARRTHVSGRNVFDNRINKNPIKTLVKAIDKNKLEETIHKLASPKLANKLFPQKIILRINK